MRTSLTLPALRPRRAFAWAAVAAATGLLLSAPADAAPRKSAGKASSRSKPKSVVKPVPANPGGIMIPKALVLRKPTQAEAQAHAVWSVRAGLNVAALQCRYSAWLRPVANYNDMLNNHLTELSDAQKVMQGHFRRLDGARGQTTFDQYNTRNYNSYSTLDAQYNFCDVAGRVGKDIRALPIGGLGPFAIGAMNDLRAALGRVVMAPALTVQMPPLPKPPLFVASPD